MSTFLNSLALVFLSEIGDKTQLVALGLSLRFRKPLTLLFAIFCSSLVSHIIVVSIGHCVSASISHRFLSFLISISFFVIGAWTLLSEKQNTTKEVLPELKKRKVFITTFVTFFLAEMGDKTQLVTAALGAKYPDIKMVIFGSVTGMLLSNSLVIWGGTALAQRINFVYISRICAVLFFAMGIFAFYHFLFP